MNIDFNSALIITGIDVLMAISIYLPMSTGVLFLLPIGTMATSAYTFAYLTIHGTPTVVAALAGILLAGLVALFGGALTAKLRGLVIAIASLGMAEIIQVFVQNFAPLGATQGLIGVPLVTTIPVTLAITVAVIALVVLVEFSPLGERIRAVEQDELAAGCVGVNVPRLTLTLQVTSGLISGLAGVLSAGYLTYVGPTEFGIQQMNQFLMAAVLGGSTTTAGSVVGGVLTGFVPQLVQFLATYQLLVYSALVIVIVLVRRQGLVTTVRLRRAITRRTWARKGKGVQIQQGLALEIKGIRKRYGGIHVLNNVTLSAHAQEVLAIIGANGAGKTTLLNVISGVIRPDSGEVRLGDDAITGLASHQIVKKGVVRTFQNLRLFGGMTVHENVAVVDAELGDSLLEMLRLREVADRDAKSLPYGYQRRLEIARALAAKPKVLLLDEPTSGMTHGEAGEVAALIKDLRAQGLTIVLIDHNLRFVMQVADRVVVLDRGAVIAEGDPYSVQQDPAVMDAYLIHTPKRTAVSET